MTYTFTIVANAVSTDPDHRTPKPPNNQDYKFWQSSVPKPAYRLCTVRVTFVDPQNARLIKVKLIKTDGTEVGNELAVNLDDWTQAWASFPSTIQRPALVSPIGTDDCGLLLLTEKRLSDAGLSQHATLYSKWPRGEDLSGEIQRLGQFIREAIARHPDLMSLPHFNDIQGLLPP